jgi:hypothetical protein
MRTFVVRGGAMAAAAVIAAGCGSSSSGSSSNIAQSEFNPNFGQVVNQFKQTSRAIGLAIEHAAGESDAQLTTIFSALAARWQSDVVKLKALKPPPSVAPQYQTLAGAATRTETDLKAIVTAARTHDANAAKQAGRQLVRDILQAKSSSQTITTKLGIG